MKETKLTQSELLKSLLLKQRQHEKLRARVEEAGARLERRKSRLLALEADITGLDGRLSEPRKVTAKQQAAGKGALQRARLIFNPVSGSDDDENVARLSRIVNSLRTHGIQAHVGFRTSPRAATELARQSVKSGDTLILVAGGDGTIVDVARELIGTPAVLGIIPIGNTNNLARSLGVPPGIDDACALIGKGTTCRIDMGRVTSSGNSDAEFFMESAGVGLNAIAAMAGQAFGKRHWRVVPRALREFFESKPGHIVVEMDGAAVATSTRMVTVSNAPFTGNKMPPVSGAKMDDGLFDVQVYDGMDSAALMQHFTATSPRKSKALKTYRVRHVRISAEAPAPDTTEQDVAREQHVIEIEVVPKALSMIVGNGIGLGTPGESEAIVPTFGTDEPPIASDVAIPEEEPILAGA